MKKIILSHPTGNANVRSTLRSLQGVNLLCRFYTSIAFFSTNVLIKYFKFGPFKEFHKRIFSISLKSHTTSFYGKEVGRLLARKFKMNFLTKHETGIFSVDAVYQSLDKKVAMVIAKDKGSEIAAVYAYEDGALESFKAAKKNNIVSMYELPIPYWRCFHNILEEEKINRPDWACTLIGLKDSAEKLQRKDDELSAADIVFVANSFTAKSLKSDFPGNLKSLKVIPYGFPTAFMERDFEKNKQKGPIKLLFVGRLSQQKGIANLLEAVEILGDKVELTLVGNLVTEACKPLNEKIIKYRWLHSLPHSEVLQIMREHYILVFPSLFEGFGMVITEAMAQGTPVITTERTAGIDIIDHGINGWLMKAGSTESLVEILKDICANPDTIPLVGKEALKTAQNRPWSVYESEHSAAICQVLNNQYV